MTITKVKIFFAGKTLSLQLPVAKVTRAKVEKYFYSNMI